MVFDVILYVLFGFMNLICDFKCFYMIIYKISGVMSYGLLDLSCPLKMTQMSIFKVVSLVPYGIIDLDAI